MVGVRKAVISHLYEDHIGGLRELRHGEIVVAEEEWEELLKPRPEIRGLPPKHIDIPGLKWNWISLQTTSDVTLAPFTESFDLMGDGNALNKGAHQWFGFHVSEKK